jgi:hypothetical protein
MPRESYGNFLGKASVEKRNLTDFDWELALRARERGGEYGKNTQNCRYIYAEAIGIVEVLAAC